MVVVVVAVVVVVVLLSAVAAEGLRVRRRLPCPVPTGRGRDPRRRCLPCRAEFELVVHGTAGSDIVVHDRRELILLTMSPAGSDFVKRVVHTGQGLVFVLSSMSSRVRVCRL